MATSTFQHVLLVGKYQTASGQASDARATMLAIAQCLEVAGCEVTLESTTAALLSVDSYPLHDIALPAAAFDLAVVVGGDGTMLWAARRLAASQIPLIGINQGRLGFITDLPLDDFAQALVPMLQGAYQPEKRGLLHSRVLREVGGQETCVFEAIAMNDVVVNRGATSGMVELRINVDGRFVSTQRADGLIVATPTGSTAYALSAGGSLLHPSLAGWILVPIAPHKLSNRPIVLPDSSVIEIDVLSGRDASANFDMQALATLLQGDRIIVTKAPHSVTFLHPLGWHYYDTLRQKLHWNEG